MIKICRAEDGQLFQVKSTPEDIESIGSLELFLHQEIGIDTEAAVAFLPDGKRLLTENVRDLGLYQEQLIFVFDKRYLLFDLEDVLEQLHATPPFQPVIEDAASTTPPIRPTQLTHLYTQTSRMHHEHINHILHSLQLQHQSLLLSFSNLTSNITALSSPFAAIAENTVKELEKQAALLEGVDADLSLISKVEVHAEFCSAAVRMAIEAGERHRHLADYVSQQKMRQVAEACAKTHADLNARFQQVDQAVDRLRTGADEVRLAVNDIALLENAEVVFHRSQSFMDRIADAAATLESPASNTEAILQELKQLDTGHREELRQIVNKKNLYTRHCVTALRRIATLNNELVEISPNLASLSTSLRAKTSFSHIQRLHGMMYAYGATVIEIVRRKEFARFFYQRAQTILDVMAKFSANERKRRQIYRGEVHGQLPFETRGMDDPVPSIDFTPSGGQESYYSFERTDIDALLHVVDDLENYALSINDGVALKAVQECRAALEKLVSKMDTLEAGFDKIAERSLMSASRLSQSRRRSVEAEERALQELSEELRITQDVRARQEGQFNEERASLQAEIARLKAANATLESDLSASNDRATKLDRELAQFRCQVESESTARRILEERNAELSADIAKQRIEIARALKDATDQAKHSEMLKMDLNKMQADFEAVKALEKKNADLVENLVEEQGRNLKLLEETRARGEDLETQIRKARMESLEVQQALKVASGEKDRLLKLQASEHERMLRDHRAEADGDRAVLDRRFSELQALLEHKEVELRELKGDLEVSNNDAVGLREELHRVKIELSEAKHVEQLLRGDLRAGRASQSDFEQRMEDSNRLIAQILDVAISFRNSHVKALHAALTMVAHPNSAKRDSGTIGGGGAGGANLADSTFSTSAPAFRHGVIGQTDTEPPPIDPSDPASALDILREFDHDHFLEAVAKTGSTIRKWQKQCKEYRERAKGKISFRNFAKGDLALFLPTRNSVSKPWAAFNVSFPHYFLQAAGHLAEQLKTREWIVARITSITERVVDQKDPTSNPYGLGDGVKYYMLEVEDWTQPSNTKRRLPSRKTAGGGLDMISPMSIESSKEAKIPPGPPDAEVEDRFEVTHPPNSRLFPVRSRSNSSPSARPSSLSRLLAQASSAPENGVQENGTNHATTTDTQTNVTIENDPSDTATANGLGHNISTSSPAASTVAANRNHGASRPRPLTSLSPPGAEALSSTSSSPAPVIPPLPSLYQNSANNPSPSQFSNHTGGTAGPGSVPASAPGTQTQFPPPSPLRPGSRASRLSNASKFSSRLPALGTVGSSGGVGVVGSSKAAPTTAVTDQQMVVSASPVDSTTDGNPFRSPITPSPPSDRHQALGPAESSTVGGTPAVPSAVATPGGALGGGSGSNNGRRRTASYHAPSPAAVFAATVTATPHRGSPLASTSTSTSPPAVNVATSTATTSGSGNTPGSNSVPTMAAPVSRPGLITSGTLSSLASSFGFGRRKKTEAPVADSTAPADTSSSGGDQSSRSGLGLSSAEALLKKF